MSIPLISILLPIHNGERYLATALDSVFRQSCANFELLAVDDGSTDRTPDLLAACRDPRLRVLRNEIRLKLAGALNRGLDEARGVFIARMDADDIMRRDRLAQQVAYLERHPEIGCCGGWAQTFGSESTSILRFPTEPDALKAFSLFYSPFAHPAVLFRRDWFVRDALRYDGSFYPTEDYELWSRAVARFPCGNVPRILIDYRVHATSMTGSEWSGMDAQTMRVQRGLLAQLGLSPSDEELRLHRAASMGQLPPAVASFEKAETWLLKLEAANAAEKRYAPQALATILNYVWYRAVMGAVRDLGDLAWRIYRESRLSTIGTQSFSRRWIVHVASLRAALLGVRR